MARAIAVMDILTVVEQVCALYCRVLLQYKQAGPFIAVLLP